MYVLTWKNPSLDANKAASIEVPVGSVVSNKASIRFTGKGAANYGTIQQENLMRIVENFADTVAPERPTVGQTWYDVSTGSLRACSSIAPVAWKAVGGIQITQAGQPPLAGAVLGDIWFQRTGSLSGILHVFTGVGRFPLGATIGGWSQVWPAVETLTGRDEYNTIRALVEQLIGTTNGGNGAIDKVNANLTDFAQLDASLVNKYLTTVPVDTNILAPLAEQTQELRVEPTSTDWDILLAAARYAINRLEMPAGSKEVSSIPFVYDGRPPPASLLALPTTDARYPSLKRRSNQRPSSRALNRLFDDTIDVLTAAIPNRYTLKGMNALAPNVDFASTTDVVTHNIRNIVMTNSISGTVSMRFQFPSVLARESFEFSGGAIQLTLTHVPGVSGTVADANLKALTDARGVVRINTDKTRVLNNTLPLTLVSTANVGVGGVGVGTLLTTQAAGGASFSITASSASPTTFTLTLAFSTTSAMNGTLMLKYDVIKSNETYLSPAVTPIFGSPNAFTASDVTSSLVVAPPVPVAEFTASTLTGPVPLSVTFTDQSTNSPTSWAWDFENDGTVDSTVQNPTKVYTTSGSYTVKLTATNLGGSSVRTRVNYLNITPQAPVAEFSATPLTGVGTISLPLSVTFTDQSTNSPTSWAWYFNNNSVPFSTLQNPTHIFSDVDGALTVKLIATNAGGSNTRIRVNYLNITSAPPISLVNKNDDYSNVLVTINNFANIPRTWHFTPQGNVFIRRTVSSYNNGILEILTGVEQHGQWHTTSVAITPSNYEIMFEVLSSSLPINAEQASSLAGNPTNEWLNLATERQFGLAMQPLINVPNFGSGYQSASASVTFRVSIRSTLNNSIQTVAQFSILGYRVICSYQTI